MNCDFCNFITFKPNLKEKNNHFENDHLKNIGCCSKPKIIEDSELSNHLKLDRFFYICEYCWIIEFHHNDFNKDSMLNLGHMDDVFPVKTDEEKDEEEKNKIPKQRRRKRIFYQCARCKRKEFLFNFHCFCERVVICENCFSNQEESVICPHCRTRAENMFQTLHVRFKTHMRIRCQFCRQPGIPYTSYRKHILHFCLRKNVPKMARQIIVTHLKFFKEKHYRLALIMIYDSFISTLKIRSRHLPKLFNDSYNIEEEERQLEEERRNLLQNPPVQVGIFKTKAIRKRTRGEISKKVYWLIDYF